MESEGAKELRTARLIAVLVYVVPLVVFPYVGRMMKTDAGLHPEMLQLLAPMLVAIGVVDYAISLFLEQKMLPRAASTEAAVQRGVLAAAVVVASLGASLAVYGLVLSLLGAPGWGAVLYVMCAVHGLHLLMRWPKYERAAEGTPYQ